MLFVVCMKNCCSSRMVFVWTVIVALLFGGALFLAFWGMPRIIKNQIHANTRLDEGTSQWDRFLELPVPMDYSVRFFQVTNPDAVLNNGSKPILKESAPYKYKLTIKKTDLRFDDIDEDSVTYKRSFSFEFDESGTTKETDKITVINPLLMAALQLTSTIERLALAGCLNKILGPTGMDKVFITHTVRELLFDGIKFGVGNSTQLGVACEIVRQRMIGIVEGIRVTEHVTDVDPDYLRLALFNFKTKNYLKTSPDGIYTVNRGRNNITALGDIMRWNGYTTQTTYGNTQSDNTTCHAIRGTDSTIYSPNIESGRELIIFNTDLCRSVKLVHVSSDETYNGIKAFKYETSETLFRPTTVIAENDCFCSKATKDVDKQTNCYLDGLFDYKPCLGAPVLVSQPHFLYADEKYKNAVVGLSPNVTKHGIYLLLEPNTGTPLQGMKRVQLNSILRKESLISFITPATMYEGVIPIFWMEEGFSLTQKYVDLLNNQYFNPVRVATGLKWGLIATFASLFAGCLYLVWRKEYFKNKKN